MKTIKIILFSVTFILAILSSLIAAILISITSTPNFFSWYLRQAWNDVSPYLPNEYEVVKEDVSVIEDATYASRYNENRFDIYYPKEINAKLPTIIWIHGGGFVSGDKSGTTVFGTLIASHGYVFVSMNYEVAPENHYPAPVIQVGELVNYLTENQDTYTMIDIDQIVIGGDSAGAHIAANYAVIQTNPTLSDETNIDATMSVEQLKGLLLFCGPYDLGEFEDIMGQHIENQRSNDPAAGILGFFVNQVGWAYFGYSNWQDAKALQQTNIIEYVTSDFPPSYITDGNVFSFMTHAKNLEEKLSSLGVMNTSYFPSDFNEGVDYVHEYQFDFENYHEEALENLERTLSFLDLIFAG